MSSKTLRPMRDDARVGVGVAEKDAAHRRTGARRANDPAMRLENVAEVTDHAAGLFPIARIERRLPATGLLGGVDHRHAVAPEQLGRGLGDLGIELVDIARDEHRHRIARPVGRIILPRGHVLGCSNHGPHPG